MTVKNELHVYSQGGPHDDVVIAGNREAFEVLWCRLERLLSHLPPVETETEMIAGDGEGYRLRIVMVGDGELERWMYPYSSEGMRDTRSDARKPYIRVTSV